MGWESSVRGSIICEKEGGGEGAVTGGWLGVVPLGPGGGAGTRPCWPWRSGALLGFGVRCCCWLDADGVDGGPMEPGVAAAGARWWARVGVAEGWWWAAAPGVACLILRSRMSFRSLPGLTRRVTMCCCGSSVCSRVAKRRDVLVS